MKKNSKIRVKRSTKELLLNMNKKERRQFIRKLKERKDPENYSIFQQSKSLWEKIRRFILTFGFNKFQRITLAIIFFSFFVAQILKKRSENLALKNSSSLFRKILRKSYISTIYVGSCNACWHLNAKI